MNIRPLFENFGSALIRVEMFVARREVFLALLLLFGTVIALFYRGAVGGDWYASGNDMRFILPELRDGRPLSWITGPWVGGQIFEYYRPVTSIAMWSEYQLFGENQAAWQAVSLIAHVLSAILLAYFLYVLFGFAIPAIIGASAWAFRWKMHYAIEWVPAQTDLFAGLFSIFGLVTFVVGLRCRKWWPMLISAIAMLLAIGCKEVAFVVPGVALMITLLKRDADSRKKVAVVLGAMAVVMISVVARVIALGGIGFLPGQSPDGGSGVSEITFAKIAKNVVSFVLPAPLFRGSAIEPLIAWVAGAGLVSALFVFRFRWHLGLLQATLTLLAITWLLGDPASWHVPMVRGAILWACVSAVLIAVSFATNAARTSFVVLCGLVLALPLYHVVYNPAGNVRYLPDIYWAMAWAVLLSGVVDRIAQRCTRSKITAAAHSGEPS